jgi:hypothetical protein
MRLISLCSPRLYLLLGGVSVIVGFLLFGHVARSRPSDSKVVWVYYTSLCETPGDSTTCTEEKQVARRAFDSVEACAAYRDIDLGHFNNPRLMGSCLRQHEV